jgi:hypothetical protein
MADAAGKNPTSPESDIGRRLLYSGGYNGDISPADSERLRREDEAERLSQGRRDRRRSSTAPRTECHCRRHPVG